MSMAIVCWSFNGWRTRKITMFDRKTIIIIITIVIIIIIIIFITIIIIIIIIIFITIIIIMIIYNWAMSHSYVKHPEGLHTNYIIIAEGQKSGEWNFLMVKELFSEIVSRR